ncbi:type II secretion system F family protein [Patescibacteria group bacterium]
MEFSYKARTPEGKPREGVIDTSSIETAAAALQRQNLIVISIDPIEKSKGWERLLSLSFERINNQDVMLLSRQLAILFDSKVPVVPAIRTLIGETEKTVIRKHLSEVLDDIQGGMPTSKAMAKHPKLFSTFYVNMVRSGEESGKLSDVFGYLADYLESSYTLIAKARSALIYPAFILFAFVAVVILILTVIVPRITQIILETGQEIPIYTKIVIGASNFFRDFWAPLIFFLALGSAVFWRYLQTEGGRLAWSRFQLSVPIIGTLYKKIYLARIADNLHTLFTAGIPVIRSLEITAEVVGNEIYKKILKDSAESVKGGLSIADSLGRHDEIPSLVVQMIKIGEETGRIDKILASMSRFYKHAVENVIENLVSLIEPVLILVLGLGVGLLVASVLMPLYNLVGAF